MTGQLNGAPRIRRARPEETERLFEIWRGAVEATHDFVTAEDRRLIAGVVRDEYLPNALLWVAVDEADRALGFMGMTGAKIDSLFIDPAWHSRGLGRAMIDHARAAHPTLAVDVNEQNAGAVGFYRRLGFVEIGRSPLDDSGKPYPLLYMKLVG